MSDIGYMTGLEMRLNDFSAKFHLRYGNDITRVDLITTLGPNFSRFLSKVGVAEDGNFYYANEKDGSIHRVVLTEDEKDKYGINDYWITKFGSAGLEKRICGFYSRYVMLMEWSKAIGIGIGQDVIYNVAEDILKGVGVAKG